MWVEIDKSIFEKGEFKALNYIYQILSWYPVNSIPRYNILINKQRVEHTDNYSKLLVDNPIYYDTTEDLIVQPFPNKVNLGSVRSKALLLFRLNHALERTDMTMLTKDSSIIDAFEISYLFEEAKSRAENFMPAYRLKPKPFNGFRPIFPIFRKLKHYAYYLEKTEEHPNLFISAEMQEIWKNNPNKEGQERILALRKQWIQEEEEKFVNKIGGLKYSSPETEKEQ